MPEFEGKLVYDEDGQYVVGNFNLSALLDTVYYSPTSNYIDIKIEKDGCKVLFNEKGNFYRRKETSTDVYGYVINGMEIEEILFNNTDEYINVVLDDGIGADYGQYCKQLQT